MHCTVGVRAGSMHSVRDSSPCMASTTPGRTLCAPSPLGRLSASSLTAAGDRAYLYLCRRRVQVHSPAQSMPPADSGAAAPASQRASTWHWHHHKWHRSAGAGPTAHAMQFGARTHHRIVSVVPSRTLHRVRAVCRALPGNLEGVRACSSELRFRWFPVDVVVCACATHVTVTDNSNTYCMLLSLTLKINQLLELL